MSKPKIIEKECVDYISAHYEHQSIGTTRLELEKLFGLVVSNRTIGRTARKMGLKAPSNRHRFKKGEVPKNFKPFPKGYNYWKGKKRKGVVPEESIAKSNRNLIAGGLNKMPIGSESIYNGCLWIKVSDGKGGKKDGWMRKDRYVYECVHGKQPKNTKFIHLNGDNTDCSIENILAVESCVFSSLIRYKAFGKGNDVLMAYIQLSRIEKALKEELGINDMREVYRKHLGINRSELG